jgi:hypothetical protein
MAVVGVRSGVRRRRSSLERCGRSLAAQRLVVGATGIGRDVRSSYNTRRRLLGEASSRCFYFLHVDVPSAGSLRPQTESMQAGYGWCLVLGVLWCGMVCFDCAAGATQSHAGLAIGGCGTTVLCVKNGYTWPSNGGSRDWGHEGVAVQELGGQGDMGLQERRWLLMMEDDAQIRTRRTTTTTTTRRARARTG